MMYTIKSISEFITESAIYDEDKRTNKVIFDSEEYISIPKFLKICKRSAEAKKAKSGSYNFGKGIKMAEMLRKNLPQHRFQCRVVRNAWNYGGNLDVTIELRSKSGDVAFRFSSADSTRQPRYSFSEVFNGTVKPSEPGEIVKDWGMGVVHGTYQSISKFDEFMSDVIGIFNDYERVNGTPFDIKEFAKSKKADQKIKAEWNKLEPKILKQYDIAKRNARKVHNWIELRQPRLDLGKKSVFYKTDEPRELRHPDEYGGHVDKLMSTKEYRSYEKAQSRISDLIDAFVKKHKLEFVWAASW